MALGIENGSVVNRSFAVGGLADAMFNWFTKIPANHGPGWYMLDDQRLLGTNPYFVVCDQASPTWNSRAVYLRVVMNSSNERLEFYTYLFWNATTHTGIAAWGGLSLTTTTGSFAYHFRGGPDIIYLSTRIGSSIANYRLTRFVGIWNATTGKGLEPDTATGTTIAEPYLEANDSQNQVSDYHNLSNYSQHLDADGKLYFDVVITGTQMRVNIYKDSLRTLLIGHTGPSTGTGARSVTADNLSGISGTLTHDFHGTNSNTIECRFLRLQLGPGEAANLTDNRRYFLIDFQNGERLVSYVKITGRVGDLVSIDFLSTGRRFRTGAYLIPYPLRWSVAGTTVSGSGYPSATVPSTNIAGSETFDGAASSLSFVSDWMQNTVALANPDDDGEYGAQEPWVVEGNRFLGKETAVLVGASAGLSPYQDRRVIDGIPYICTQLFGDSQGRTVATLVLDQEST